GFSRPPPLKTYYPVDSQCHSFRIVKDRSETSEHSIMDRPVLVAVESMEEASLEDEIKQARENYSLSMAARSRIEPNHKIYIGSVPMNLEEEQLRQLLSRFGKLKDLKLIADRFGRFAIAEYYVFECCHVAMAALNRMHLGDKKLNAQWANEEMLEHASSISALAAETPRASDSQIGIRTVRLQEAHPSGFYGMHIVRNVICYVAPDWPAGKQGVREGDEIISIDGMNVENLSRTEIAKLLLLSDSGHEIKIRFNSDLSEDCILSMKVCGLVV
ncbi:hypothetical protein PENTCL1PPCAC_10946, partial [Pristionchus entomophagus]